jgi:hypothetical protein
MTPDNSLEVRQLKVDEIDFVAGGGHPANYGLTVSVQHSFNHNSIAANVALGSQDVNQTAVSGNGNKIYEFVYL